MPASVGERNETQRCNWANCLLILRSNTSSDSMWPFSWRTLQPIGYFDLANTQGMPVILSMFMNVSLYPKEPLRTMRREGRFEPLTTWTNPKPVVIRAAAINNRAAHTFPRHFLRCMKCRLMCCFMRVFAVGAPQFGHLFALLLISLPQSLHSTNGFWMPCMRFVRP